MIALYDIVLRATLREEKLKGLLVAQAGLRPGQRVLDLGCGTATLTIMLKRACPDAEVVGLDPDPAALRIARAKATAAGLAIELRQALASEAPFPPASFDRVVSSLMLHHLTAPAKRAALARARELLRPGGELHVLDWGRPQNWAMRVAFLSIQVLDGFAATRDNVQGRLVPMMVEAGFVRVVETHRAATVFGTLTLYRAEVPDPTGSDDGRRPTPVGGTPHRGGRA